MALALIAAACAVAFCFTDYDSDPGEEADGATDTVPEAVTIDGPDVVTVKDPDVGTDGDSGEGVPDVVEPAFHTITVTSTDGGEVSGGGDFAPGSEFTLTAAADSDHVFCGWYGADGLVTYEDTLTGTATEDASYEARFLPRDGSFTVSLSSETAPSTITVVPTETDAATARSVVFTNAFTGYRIPEYDFHDLVLDVGAGAAVDVALTTTFRDGTEAKETQTVIVDQKVTRAYSWMYQTEGNIGSETNDASASIAVETSFKEYAENRLDREYRDESGALGGGAHALYERFLDYDGVLGSVCDALEGVTAGMSDRERAECVLKFAQSFDYTYDRMSRSAQELEPYRGDEWWEHPAEILYEKGGDCEDHAILFAGVMLSMGYDVALCHVVLNTNGHHLAAGIVMDGIEGETFEAGGKTYVYCEATATGAADGTSGFPIGEATIRSVRSVYPLALPSPSPRRCRRPSTPGSCRTRGPPRTWCTARGSCRPSPFR